MKIGICTPTRSGYMHHRHMASFLEAAAEAAKYGVELRHYVFPGCAYITVARNILVSDALNDGCDWIVFIDDDIAYRGVDLFKLIQHGAPFVGAAPARRHMRWNAKPGVIFRPFVKSPTDPMAAPIMEHQTPQGRVWEVEGLATAFLAVAAHVFKQLEPKTELHYVDTRPIPVRNYFWLDIVPVNGKPSFEGEDYNLCRKWREIGGHVYLDPDIRLEHFEGNVSHDYCPADMAEQ